MQVRTLVDPGVVCAAADEPLTEPPRLANLIRAPGHVSPAADP